MAEKSGYPCFEGRILQAQAYFKELDDLANDGNALEDCLLTSRPASSTTPETIRKFVQQWVYVLCRLAARCKPMPEPDRDWGNGETVGRIRFCSLAPIKGLLDMDSKTSNVFLPVEKPEDGVQGLSPKSHRLFLALDCKSREVTENCESCIEAKISNGLIPVCNGCNTDDCSGCDVCQDDDLKSSTRVAGAFGATAIAIMHAYYIAIPTEDALTIDKAGMSVYKPYLAWYLKRVFPDQQEPNPTIKKLKMLCGTSPTKKPTVTLAPPEAFAFSNKPKSLTEMPHC